MALEPAAQEPLINTGGLPVCLEYSRDTECRLGYVENWMSGVSAELLMPRKSRALGLFY